MKQRLVTVIGGSGFLGRHLVKQLCAEGYLVRVLCRDTVAAQFLKVSGNVGQVALEHVDATTPDAFKGKLNGSFAVVNLLGVLYQSGAQRFSTLHTKAAAAAATEATRIGVPHFVHVSALAVDKSRANYAKTKLAGEVAVKEAFPSATIVRPSLIIGPEDGFFQRFARMSLLAPALPLIGGGKTLFQPIMVSDVAHAICAAIITPDAAGNTYELAGPKTYSFRALLELMARITKRHVCLLNLPRPLAYVMGAFSELSPFAPPITRDQVRALATDNVASSGALQITDLGITPANIETVLPELLKRFIKE